MKRILGRSAATAPDPIAKPRVARSGKQKGCRIARVSTRCDPRPGARAGRPIIVPVFTGRNKNHRSRFRPGQASRSGVPLTHDYSSQGNQFKGSTGFQTTHNSRLKTNPYQVDRVTKISVDGGAKHVKLSVIQALSCWPSPCPTKRRADFLLSSRPWDETFDGRG